MKTYPSNNEVTDMPIGLVLMAGQVKEMKDEFLKGVQSA